MENLFDQNRTYVLGDPELELIGDREKLAQWRHKGIGPAFNRLGRKIVYRGEDLNAWAEANRVDPAQQEARYLPVSRERQGEVLKRLRRK